MKKQQLFVIIAVATLVLAGIGVGYYFTVYNQDEPSLQFGGRASKIEKQCRNSKNKNKDSEIYFVPGSIEFYFKDGLTETEIKKYFTENNFPEKNLVSVPEFSITSITVPQGQEECWIQELSKHPELEAVFQTPLQTLN